MRFNIKEQEFIKRWFQSGQFYFQTVDDNPVMNCKADCTDCIFGGDSCIIGGTADWSVKLQADLREDMPEEFL